MLELLNAAAFWGLGTALSGGLLLLAVAIAVRRTPAPALRQRLGEWGVCAALLVAVLRLGPVWLPLPWHLPAAPAAPAPVASVTPPAPAPERVPEPEEFALVWVERSTHLTPLPYRDLPPHVGLTPRRSPAVTPSP